MADQRELLELAALATGRTATDGWEWCDEAGVMTRFASPDHIEDWDPLTDDGDCARMESQLGIDVVWFDGFVGSAIDFSEQNEMQLHERFADHNNDRNAARRLASTRVAAEIGKRTREAQG